MKPQLIALLARSPWLRELGPDLHQAFDAFGRIQRLRDGETLYRQGDAPNGLFGVIEGTVRLVSHTEAGSSFQMLLARSGDWFGEVSTLDGEARRQDAISRSEATVLHLRLPDIERIGREQPELWRAIGRLAVKHQRAALAYIQWFSTAESDARVAWLLMSRHAHCTDDVVAISQEEIAASVGLTRPTVGAILRRFRDAGEIVPGYGTIRILEPKSLSRRIARR